jgi:hypothetical protein
MNETLSWLSVSPSLLAFYANPDCKQCRGKGVVEKSTRNVKYAPNWGVSVQFCNCILDSIRDAQDSCPIFHPQ